MLPDAIKTGSTDECTRAAAVVATTTASSIVEEMFSVDKTIKHLLKRKTYLEQSSADAASKKTHKRLKIMEDAIEKAYEVFDQLNKRGVTG